MQDHPNLRDADITDDLAAELLDRYEAYVGRDLEQIPPGAAAQDLLLDSALIQLLHHSKGRPREVRCLGTGVSLLPGKRLSSSA
jgi:hypothetical protein